MKTAFLDARSGLSGDMIAGAMLDAGADFDELRAALSSLPVQGFSVSQRRKSLSGISALKFDVEVSTVQPERHLREISEILKLFVLMLIRDTIKQIKLMEILSP